MAIRFEDKPDPAKGSKKAATAVRDAPAPAPELPSGELPLDLAEKSRAKTPLRRKAK